MSLLRARQRCLVGFTANNGPVSLMTQEKSLVTLAPLVNITLMTFSRRPSIITNNNKIIPGVNPGQWWMELVAFNARILLSIAFQFHIFHVHLLHHLLLWWFIVGLQVRLGEYTCHPFHLKQSLAVYSVDASSYTRIINCKQSLIGVHLIRLSFSLGLMKRVKIPVRTWLTPTEYHQTVIGSS